MDPLLWEIIHSVKINEDEEVEALIRLQDPEQKIKDVRIISRLGSIATCMIKKNSLRNVRNLASVLSLKAPRLVSPDLELYEPRNNEALITPYKTDIRRPKGIRLTGKGVVIGIIDWGCDFNHPSFINTDGTSRILALWDQRNNSIYYHDEINNAIQCSNPYSALGYHPADSDAGNGGTHGTHVMDIAAGNGRGDGPMGIAPEADLIFVHLANKNTSGISNLGNAKNIIDAVAWIDKMVEGKPWVVNLSVGKHGGPHNGSTLVEMAFDELLSASKNKFIVQSTGNYYTRDIHRSGRMKAGDIQMLELLVDKADITPNELEIWMTSGNEFEVSVESANGLKSRWVPLNDQEAIVINGELAGRIYNRRSDPNNLDNHIDIFFYPEALPGNWKVYLKAKKVSDGIYHAWLERDDAIPHCQTKFRKSDSDGNYTLGTIACSHIPLIVGAYNHHSPFKEITSFSSAGPTRDYRLKPDLVAPGYKILAARSAPYNYENFSGLYTRKSGTSMAAPHVTGAVALCLQGALKPLKSSDIRELILSNTSGVEKKYKDVYRYGKGYLNIEKSLEALDDLNKQMLMAVSDGKNIYATINIGKQKHNKMETNNEHYLDYIEGRLPESASTEEDLLEAILDEAEYLPQAISAENIYREIVEHESTDHVHYQNSLYEVIACPKCNQQAKIEMGDVLLRSALGEPGLAHLAILSESDLLTQDQLVDSNITSECDKQGYYSIVIEARPFKRTRRDRFARRLYDINGQILPGQRVLRFKKSRIFPENHIITEENILTDNGEDNFNLIDRDSVDAGYKLILKRTGVEFEQHAVPAYNNKQRAGYTYITDGCKHYYYFTPRGPQSKKVVKGYRGKLIVEKPNGRRLEWDCIERANGYRHIRPGKFKEVTMLPRKSKPDGQDLWVGGQVFIHASSYPCFLDGCIAPGKEIWEGYGVKGTKAAMKEIIEALGGWQYGKKIAFDVYGEKTIAG